MVRRRRTLLIAAAVVILLGIVAGLRWRHDRQRAAGVPSAGEISFTWRGTHRGKAILPATLNWCPGTRLGLLQGVSADTGIVIALYEESALTRGPHAAFAPDLQQDVPRPGAAAGIRWTRDSATILGFRALSGLVEVADVGTTASGTLDLRMQIPGGIDTVVVRGQFKQIPVTALAVGCT